MAIRAHTVVWRPRGLSDAVDGTNAFPGAMSLLANLIPDPATRDVFVCRPAQTVITNFGGFDHPGFISGYLVVGDIVYGLIASSDTPGHDLPFAYDLANNSFLPVDGITAANVPLSPPSTGAWTPPILDQVSHRIVVTHPGFNDTVKFGWFDISSLTVKTTGNLVQSVAFTGDTDTTHQPFITGNPVSLTNQGYVFPNNGDPVPVVLGEAVSGPGIAAGTTILEATLTKLGFTGDTTSASPNIANVTVGGTLDTTGIFVGQQVYGDGIPPGTTVLSINRLAHSLVLSANATKTQASNAMSVIGSELRLSQNVTATADNQTFQANNNLITGNPNILGVQPGDTISGAGIPAGATIVSTKPITFSATGTVTDGSNSVTMPNGAQSVAVGMSVAGLGVPEGAVVTTVDIPNSVITLSEPVAVAGGASGFVTLNFAGAAIQIDKTITASASGVALTIAGGTPTRPLWGAGDTMTNPLPSQPVGVAQMSGRAWYACGTDGIVFSDAGFACVVSNVPQVQALLPGNGLPVTALGKLQLSNQFVGGIVQGLIAFQRDANMLQLTGDMATQDLRLNNLPVGTGTHAPLSIFSCQSGVGFISPLGLRFVDFSGSVTPPVGQGGDGVTAPFVLLNNPPIPSTGSGSPLEPSRVCAACNGNTVRITCPQQDGISVEYWYDINRQIWTGPHTCPASLIQVWSDTYLVAPLNRHALLVRSDDLPTLTSSYVEHNAQLNWAYAPVLLPDNGLGVVNTMVEATVAMTLPVLPNAVKVYCVDEGGEVMDQLFVVGTQPGPREHGFSWNAQVWGPGLPAFQQFGLHWHEPMDFKQARVILNGTSTAQNRVGNLYLKVKEQGYQLFRPVGYLPALYNAATGQILVIPPGQPFAGEPLVAQITVPILNPETGEVLTGADGQPLTQQVEAPY